MLSAADWTGPSCVVLTQGPIALARVPYFELVVATKDQRGAERDEDAYTPIGNAPCAGRN